MVKTSVLGAVKVAPFELGQVGDAVDATDVAEDEAVEVVFAYKATGSAGVEVVVDVELEVEAEEAVELFEDELDAAETSTGVATDRETSRHSGYGPTAVS